MGWSYDDRTEFFSMSDLLEKFSLDKMSPSPAAVNYSKLDHFNGLHIRSLSLEDLTRRLKPFFDDEGFDTDDTILERITPLIQDRIRTLDEAVMMAGFFFEENVYPTTEDLIGKGLSEKESRAACERALTSLADIDPFTSSDIEMKMRALADELSLKPGQLFGILRVAVTGQKVSPPLFESMEIVGKNKTLLRIKNAIELLRGLPSRGHSP